MPDDTDTETDAELIDAPADIRDGGEGPLNVDGQVTLDLVPPITNVTAEVGQDTPDLFGGAISIPKVSPTLGDA